MLGNNVCMLPIWHPPSNSKPLPSSCSRTCDLPSLVLLAGAAWFRLLPAAADETKQPRKKHKTGHMSSSSSASHRAPVSCIQWPYHVCCTPSGPGLFCCRPFTLCKHSHFSMGPPPRPLQPLSTAPAPQHAQAARLNQPTLLATGAILQNLPCRWSPPAASPLSHPPAAPPCSQPPVQPPPAASPRGASPALRLPLCWSFTPG